MKQRFEIVLAFALLLSLCGPAAAVEQHRASIDASWPVRFFSGATEGTGELRILLSGAKPVQVQSRGGRREDGTLVLRQTIRMAGEKPSTREWRLVRVGRDRYAGTLSDAAGPVAGEVSGNRLSLRYTMKGALRLRIQQVLTLQPDGRTIANSLKATKFGLPIASLRETIRRR